MRKSSNLSHVEIEHRRKMLMKWIQALEEAKDTIVFKTPPQSDEDSVRFNARDIVHGLDAPPDWDVLIQGLKRALSGDSDPFRLRQRGRKPTYSTKLLVHAVAIVNILRKRGITLEEARAQAAEIAGISEETIRDAMRNDEIDWFAHVAAAFCAMHAQGRDPLDVCREHIRQQLRANYRLDHQR